VSRIADPQPPYCAVCFQKPEGRCVDFEAAYDGPVIPGAPAHIPIDDLVICESCLEEAFDLIDPQNQRRTIKALTIHTEVLEADIAAKDKIIQGLRSSTNELVEHPIRTFPGRPKLEGVTDEVRAEINERRFAEGPSQKKRKKVTA
jgi:hypothetical protein